MATRNLAIREAVYRKLVKEKRHGESFSDVIERILEKRGSLLPLWGALADSKNLAQIEAGMVKIRNRASPRYRKGALSLTAERDLSEWAARKRRVERLLKDVGDPLDAIEGVLAHVKTRAVQLQHGATEVRSRKALAHRR